MVSRFDETRTRARHLLRDGEVMRIMLLPALDPNDRRAIESRLELLLVVIGNAETRCDVAITESVNSCHVD